MVAGLGLLSYPLIGNMINYFDQLSVINTYNNAVAELNEQEVQEALKKAEQYNQSLNGSVVADPFAEEEEQESVEFGHGYDALNLEDLTIAYIKIPKINADLPIYNSTNHLALQKGVGHLENTALPVGGKGTHCVLTGHSALPASTIFTDLEKMEIGDYFYIYVLDQILAYRIDQIKVVEPTDTSELKINKEQDYITLITCTPYSVNTHRLLVRGVRDDSVLSDPSKDKSITSADEITKQKDFFSLLLGNQYLVISTIVIAALLVVIIILIIVKRKKKKGERKLKHENKK